jgi:hypothetical protein
MKTGFKESTILLFLLLASTLYGQTAVPSQEIFDHYNYPRLDFPLNVNPIKWKHQPDVDSWETMEKAAAAAQQDFDGYGLYQLAYLEYVHQYTALKLDPKTMLYNAFEIGKTNGDPYLMYWVTDLEGTVFYDFEYLDRRRNHARLTDSISTKQMEWPVLFLLADLNDSFYLKIKSLSQKYIRYANWKNETYGLLKLDIRNKAEEIKKKISR